MAGARRQGPEAARQPGRIKMPSYRIYILDSDTGHRAPGEWLDAADDDEATRLAHELAGKARCEVWLKTKLVAIVARGNQQS